MTHYAVTILGRPLSPRPGTFVVWPPRPRFCPASPNPVLALPRSAWSLAAGSLRSSFLFLPPFPPRRALLTFLPNPHHLSKPDSTAPSSMVSENFLDKDTAVLVFSKVTAARLGSQHVGMDYLESFKMKMMTIQICVLIMKTPCGKDVHVLRLLPRPDPGERDGGKRCRPVSLRVPGCGPQAGWRAWSLRALSTPPLSPEMSPLQGQCDCPCQAVTSSAHSLLPESSEIIMMPEAHLSFLARSHKRAPQGRASQLTWAAGGMRGHALCLVRGAERLVRSQLKWTANLVHR